MLTRDNLVETFRVFGIEAGDSLIVHISFRGLGEVEGTDGKGSAGNWRKAKGW